MPVLQRFSVKTVDRRTIEVYVLQLRDGRIVSRTSDELAAAPDEERIAAGLEPAPAAS